MVDEFRNLSIDGTAKITPYRLNAAVVPPPGRTWLTVRSDVEITGTPAVGGVNLDILAQGAPVSILRLKSK